MVLGGDLGGTSTRILVAGTDGRERGRSIAAAGNPVSHPDGAAAAFGDALRAALARVDPGQVEASVIGVAGVSALRTPPVAARFGRVWADAGLRCDPGYATDLEVAFAAGTPGPDGSVLVAGTGGDRRRRDRPPVDADRGWPWLAAGRRRAGVLARARGRPGRSAPSTSGSPWPPGRRRAPRAGRDRDGDPEARSIVERAAAALLTILGRIRDPGETTPILLAGSLTSGTSPVGTTLRALLAGQFAGPVRPAGTEVGGAAWLALAALDPALATRDAHARLCA
ncbi:MAG TPA: ATPase [Actinomycetota bacterium]|nr:ATPase [Actinomycetota bacterium]